MWSGSSCRVMDDDYAASVPCQQAARRWGSSLSPTYAAQFIAVCRAYILAETLCHSASLASQFRAERFIAALASTYRRTSTIYKLREIERTALGLPHRRARARATTNRRPVPDAHTRRPQVD